MRENTILTTRTNDPAQTLTTGHQTTLSDEKRKALLEKYGTLLIDGVSSNEAAGQVGYSLRAFQLWPLNSNQVIQKERQKFIT